MATKSKNPGTDRPWFKHEFLQDDQQAQLMAKVPYGEVLTPWQMDYLRSEGTIFSVHAEQSARVEPHVHRIDQIGESIVRFSSPTFLKQWHVDVYLHRNTESLRISTGSRSSGFVFGTTVPRVEEFQIDGRIADIHLCMDRLNELTVVHEAVHAGGYLGRHVDPLVGRRATKRIADESWISWREEIQCRTMETLSLHILKTLHGLGIPCVPLRESPLD